jgi:hypothetical protein
MMPKPMRSLKGFFAGSATNDAPCCYRTTVSGTLEKQPFQLRAGIGGGHEGAAD